MRIKMPRLGPRLLAGSDLTSPRGSTPRISGRYDADAFGRASEAIARFLGTGRFLAGQTVFVIGWIILNTIGFIQSWDPYPFILLNLTFSTQAAYAAPLILLAQTRQADRDKVAAEMIEAHREEVSKNAIAHQAAVERTTNELKQLLESNTDLTRQDKELTEQVAALTREIHARLKPS
jgi:uncharacterized membrane protein